MKRRLGILGLPSNDPKGSVNPSVQSHSNGSFSRVMMQISNIVFMSDWSAFFICLQQVLLETHLWLTGFARRVLWAPTSIRSIGCDCISPKPRKSRYDLQLCKSLLREEKKHGSSFLGPPGYRAFRRGVFAQCFDKGYSVSFCAVERLVFTDRIRMDLSAGRISHSTAIWALSNHAWRSRVILE